MARLILGDSEPLFVGGTRLVFQHPEFRDRCIKVLRPDRTGAERRARKSGWKRLLPASAFDDQLKEIRAYRELMARAPDPTPIWRHVPEYHGTVETERGVGIVTQLYRNADDSWPRNLEQCLPRGMTPALAAGLRAFASGIEQHGVLTRDLLPHNMIAVEQIGGGVQVLVVDGIGNADFIPLARYSQRAARAKVRRKLKRLEQRVRMLLPLQDQEGLELCSS